MDMLVLGGGQMGLAIAHDLADHGADVTVADMDAVCMSRLGGINEDISFRQLDVSQHHEVSSAMRHCDVVISALPYDFNYAMAQLAIANGVHFCDLGGNNAVVQRELTLHLQAEQSGVTVIPDCGLAPGLTNILSAHLIKTTAPQHVHIRVGGLPLNPQPPLNYQLVFSVHGLINEYVEPARIITDGRTVDVLPLTAVESISFEDFPDLEAFYTSGGTSTLPDTFHGLLETLDYKTIRYPGHCAHLRLLKDLGFFAPLHRPFTERILAEALDISGNDVVLVRVTAEGDGAAQMEIVDRGNLQTGISAMMRTTGFPTAIIARMLGDGHIDRSGAHPPETCVPFASFRTELERRAITVVEQTIP